MSHEAKLRKWTIGNARPSHKMAKRTHNLVHKTEIAEYRKEYNRRQAVIDRRKVVRKIHRRNHPEYHRNLKAKYFQKHKAKIYHYIVRRRAAIPSVKLACLTRNRINNVLQGKTALDKATMILIGCDWDQLKCHLESQFKPGMAWSNWSRYGWHIDHIKPIAAFDLTNEGDLMAAFHFSNLKPEWHKTNLSKGSFYNGRRWTHSDHGSFCASHATVLE